MNLIIAIAVSAVLGYMLGSINSAIITVRLLKGQDIRTMGSKNAGLTNTLRCCGKGCALITLIGDLAKGVIAVFLSRMVAGMLDAGLSPDNDTHFIGYVAGLFAILGHVFPIYFGFKGGKGVLVGVSTFLAVDWKVFLILIGIFAVILSISKYVSLSSIISSALCPFITFVMAKVIEGQSIGNSLLYTGLCIPMAVMIIYMHRSNIERLKNGTENRFSFHSKKE